MNGLPVEQIIFFIFQNVVILSDSNLDTCTRSARYMEACGLEAPMSVKYIRMFLCMIHLD